MKIRYIILVILLFFQWNAFSVAFASNKTNAAAQKKRAAKEVCIQLYSVRDSIHNNNLESVLHKLAAMGYTSVEAANYKNGKFYNLSPLEFKRLVEKEGMKMLSSHANRPLTDEELSSGKLDDAMKWWDKCIADHKSAGMKYIVTPWMSVPKTIKDLDTYCKYYNEIGKRCKAAGLQYGYHNHSHEFQKLEDKEVMYDYMLKHTNPEYVFFQMDVYWVVRGQNSPVDYMNQYPGRFKMLHIKDHREIGQSGMVGFDAIFRNANKAGVQCIVAEIEKYSVPVFESVKQSIDYLLNASFVPKNYPCK